MRTLTQTVILLTLCISSFAQQYFSKSAKIKFDATTKSSPEKIEAINPTGTCVIDSKTGVIQLSVLIQGFEFERALMQEHFNENYLESSKFPKALFKGNIKDPGKLDFTKDGVYILQITGTMSLHGESKNIETTGKIEIKSGIIFASAEFLLPFSDYKISIPGIVSDKVAKSAQVNVRCVLEPLKK